MHEVSFGKRNNSNIDGAVGKKAPKQSTRARGGITSKVLIGGLFTMVLIGLGFMYVAEQSKAEDKIVSYARMVTASAAEVDRIVIAILCLIYIDNPTLSQKTSMKSKSPFVKKWIVGGKLEFYRVIRDVVRQNPNKFSELTTVSRKDVKLLANAIIVYATDLQSRNLMKLDDINQEKIRNMKKIAELGIKHSSLYIAIEEVWLPHRAAPKGVIVVCGNVEMAGYGTKGFVMYLKNNDYQFIPAFAFDSRKEQVKDWCG